jgi:hypothetical protein
MKNKKLIAFVVVLAIVSLSCNYLFPSKPNKTSNGPVVDFVTAAEPLNVTVQLDDKSTASSTITPAGGSLSLIAKNGTVFKLDIPAKALEADTLITMTMVKSLTGAPLDESAVAAVQLEPSGLFFSDIVTLTIVPAQEIPIKNQIIFGYEGDGQDYHLTIVDPKSKEIKIKLMEFSGAGVGSGGDAQWAANLQIQANNSATRLNQKMGEAIQTDRRSDLLGGESNKSGEMIVSYMDQFYDQVVLKEIAAAELDCIHAQQALDDLLILERLRQFLGGSPSDQIATTHADQALHLADIGAKCKKAYHISGAFGEVGAVEGNACDATKPFTIYGVITMVFTPADENSGSFTYSGGPENAAGSGSYTIGNGTLKIAGSGTLGTGSNSGSLTFTATPIDPATCKP